MHSETVIKFWFEEIKPKSWFIKDENFDYVLITKFSKIHSAAINCELSDWRINAEGRLAEIIVLDQFSRNMFRDTPQAFAYDALALILAQEAISSGDALHLPVEKRSFIYMPFMHSESLAIHEVGLKLFTELGVEGTLDYEKRHKVIIEKFGRYPHRNQILGRISTDSEIEFLNQPGSSF